MPYRNILAVVSGHLSDIAVLEAARVVARHFQSHVDVMFVSDQPHSLPYLSAGVAPGVVASLVDSAEASVKAKREKADSVFRHWVQSCGLCMREQRKLGAPSALLTTTWIDRSGRGEQIGLQGKCADLIVMARPEATGDAADGLLFAGAVESALFKSGRPVLFVPPEMTRLPPPESWSTVIAWNGSSEAAHAVGSAIPLLLAAKTVKIFCGMEAEKGEVCDVHELKQLQRYLSLQPVKADLEEAIKSRHAGKDILAQATKCDAALIVMGAFSHSRMRELVLGGATKYVLAHAPVLVLMAH